MKRLAVKLGTSAALALAALLVVSNIAAAARSPFVGAWESTDIDGSYQRLVIGGGPGDEHTLVYYDYGATVCGVDPTTGEILYPALVRGGGEATGDLLSGEWDVWCLGRPPTFYGTFGFHLSYDAATDTLTDAAGVIWTRK